MTTFARALFDAHCTAMLREDELTKHIFRILGIEILGDVPWPFEDHRYDHYDASLELDGCVNEFRLTPEQRTAFWELGFYKIWLNHLDGWETYYARAFGGESRTKKRETTLPNQEPPHA